MKHETIEVFSDTCIHQKLSSTHFRKKRFETYLTLNSNGLLLLNLNNNTKYIVLILAFEKLVLAIIVLICNFSFNELKSANFHATNATYMDINSI